MRLLRYAWGLAPLTAGSLLVGACQQEVASVGFDMRFPQGVLDEIGSLELRVMNPDGASCDAATGVVTGEGADLKSFPLEQGACSNGATWCKTITLDKDGNEKLFEVVGRDASNLERARGCTLAVIDQDPLNVDIQAFRVNPPKCCNDGVLQVGEQCDNATVAANDCQGNATNGAACTAAEPSEVCECDCLAKEILLSIDNTDLPNLTNAAGTKSDVQLAFSGGQGTVANSLRATFVDSDTMHSSAPDINMRLLTPELFSFPHMAPTTILSQQLRLKECNLLDSPVGIAAVQKEPALAKINDATVGVVFASADKNPPNFDIEVSAQGPSGCAETADIPLVVNSQSASTAGSCEHPAIAGGPDGMGLIVFNQTGNLRGRIWSPNMLNAADDTFIPAAGDIDIATAGTGVRPRVAGNANGWVVAFQTAASTPVSYVTVDAAGSAAAPVQVSTAGEPTGPDVAMISDGRFAVVWQSGGNVFVQRYDAAGTAVAGDQDNPINVGSPPASQPAIAATSDEGGFYVVAWAADDGSVWSRILDGASGFRSNSVNGQDGDYLASHPAIAGPRKGPAVAIGGGGFIAIGYSNEGSDSPGIQVRRFPYPGAFQ